MICASIPSVLSFLVSLFWKIKAGLLYTVCWHFVYDFLHSASSLHPRTCIAALAVYSKGPSETPSLIQKKRGFQHFPSFLNLRFLYV